MWPCPQGLTCSTPPHTRYSCMIFSRGTSLLWRELRACSFSMPLLGVYSIPPFKKITWLPWASPHTGLCPHNATHTPAYSISNAFHALAGNHEQFTMLHECIIQFSQVKPIKPRRPSFGSRMHLQRGAKCKAPFPPYV